MTERLPRGLEIVVVVFLTAFAGYRFYALVRRLAEVV